MISRAFGGRARRASVVTGIALFLRAGIAQAAPTGETEAPELAPSSLPPGVQASEEASTRFKRGLRLFDEGDYALALVEFERAYQLAPNYRALYNIGLVNMQLGRYADAKRTFDRYLHDGGDEITPARKAEVANSLAELKLRTATIDVSANVSGAEMALDGKPIDAALFRGPTLIDAGEHTFRAVAPGYLPALQTVTLAGGDVASVHLQLVRSSPLPPVDLSHDHDHDRERGRALFVPGVVTTGVLAAGAIVSGAIMLAERSRLNTLEGTIGSSQADRTSAANAANAWAATADICTGLAIVAGGVSLYLSLRVDHAPKTSSGALVPEGVTFSGSF